MRYADFIGSIHRERDSVPKHMVDGMKVAVCDTDGTIYCRNFEIVWEGGELLIRFNIKEDNEIG